MDFADRIKEEFLCVYEKQTLSSIGLPEGIAGNYSIEACLKDTKDKQAYLLRSKTDGARFILKVADRLLRSELENEYNMLSSLTYASMPRVKAFFEDKRSVYLLREYVEGSSLHQIIESKGVLPEYRVIEILISVCENLNALHRQSPPIIHRDIKAQNIIITPEGKPILIDLGTARRYRQDALQDTVFMGTHATAAPEQFGFAQTDVRCDIYGLGMLMVYLLTGEFRTDAAALNGISQPLRHIISTCIEMDPKRRYANAEKLKKALERIQKNPMHRFTTRFITGFMAGFLAASLLAAAFFFLIEPAKSLKTQGVKFSSPLIEKAVRVKLNKKDGEPILPEELANVHQLAICGNTVIEDLNKYDHYCDQYILNGETVNSHGAIDSLEDLRQLKNLKTLVLDKQNIHDLSPLKDLPLKTLELKSNQIVDLSPLKQCIGLETLDISANPVKDINPIASLENLESLNISFTEVTDISSIDHLRIRYFDMFEVPLHDYASLKRFTVLESLGVRFAPEDGLQVIGSLTRLKSLAVFCCNISSLDTLASLSDLQSLNLNSNRISDLSKIGYFPKLQFFDVNNNPIQSLEPLKKLPQLSCVHIANSNVTDLSVLLEMPGLRDVGCDRAQSDTLGMLSKNLQFNIEIQ